MPNWILSFALGGLMIAIGVLGLSKVRWLWQWLNKHPAGPSRIERIMEKIYAIGTGLICLSFAGLFSLFVSIGLSAIGAWMSFWTKQATGIDPSWPLVILIYVGTAYLAIMLVWRPERKRQSNSS